VKKKGALSQLKPATRPQPADEFSRQEKGGGRFASNTRKDGAGAIGTVRTLRSVLCAEVARGGTPRRRREFEKVKGRELAPGKRKSERNSLRPSRRGGKRKATSRRFIRLKEKKSARSGHIRQPQGGRQSRYFSAKKTDSYGLNRLKARLSRGLPPAGKAISRFSKRKKRKKDFSTTKKRRENHAGKVFGKEEIDIRQIAADVESRDKRGT